MKKLLLVSSALIFTTTPFSQEFSLVSQTDELISIRFDTREIPFEYTEIDGEMYVDFTKTYRITGMESGKPALPVITESVMLPATGNITLGFSYGEFTDYENIMVAPSKGSLKRNVDPADVPYTFNPEVYTKDKGFPDWIETFSEPFVMRNSRGVTISICPYSYNPVQKTLRVYHSVDIIVQINPFTYGVNELPEGLNLHDGFSGIYRQFYLNGNAALGKYTAVEEQGEMLIIADDALIDEIQVLADWKNQRGIKTTVVGTSTAGTTDATIKAYVSSFYTANPNLIYLLLVGDHADVPAHTYGISGGEQLWSDSYYGQLSGGGTNYYPEIFVGRFSSSSAAEITTMVERTMEYEKTPAAGDWMEKAIGLASDEGAGIGDDGEPDWQHARNNRTELMAFGYTTVHEFYDGSHGGADAAGNPSSGIIATAVNSGVGLFNYTGHGSLTTCVTGNFDTGDVDGLTNNGFYPYVISVACNNGTFAGSTCLSEVWLTSTNGGNPAGAIAAAGSSILMAWAEPMQTQDEMTQIIAENYPTNKKTTLGGLFYNGQMSMLEDYSASSTAKEVMQTWVLFGDPSVEFRNKQTLTLTATHTDSVLLGETSITVDCSVEGAMIGISKANVYQGYGIISGGTTTVTIPAVDSFEPLMVTATRQNYVPFQDSIFVIDAQVTVNEAANAVLRAFPNPTKDVLNVSWGESDNNALIQLTDVTGKVVYSNTVSGSGNTIATDGMAAGIYILRVNIGAQSLLSKIVIE